VGVLTETLGEAPSGTGEAPVLPGLRPQFNLKCLGEQEVPGKNWILEKKQNPLIDCKINQLLS